MEGAVKALDGSHSKQGEERLGDNESDEEDPEPPSPIQVGSERALTPDLDFPDPQELRKMDAETQSRLKAFLEVAGVKLSHVDARTFQDPEILRKLTNSVSNALDEAASALNRMRSCKPSETGPTPHSPDDFKMEPSSSSPPHHHHSHPPYLLHPHPPHPSHQLPSQTEQPQSIHKTMAEASLQDGAHTDSVIPQHVPASTSLPPAPLNLLQVRPQGVVRSKAPPPAVGHQQPVAGDIQALQQLLGQAGHNIHDTTEEGESLLSLACSAGYYELAEVLLRMRAGIEDRGIKDLATGWRRTPTGDSTPLMEAASGGFADIVKLLIDHGANVNATSSVGNSALTYACCGGYQEVVKILLENGAEVEHQNENGHTPLMEAASCGHVGVAKLLLESGADINTHSNEFKESALTLACYKGHLDMVKFLLNSGADKDHKTDEMHTALMEACMDGHVEVARLLLDHGAQVNMPNDSFESPLTLAGCGGHYELATLLLDRGADLEEVNDEGYTPLMESAREGHEDVVQLLVSCGANINAQTEETQETALTLACCGGFLDVVQYLFDHKADIELGASTPLMEAAQEGHIDIVKFLIGKGANIHAETNTMDTALTYACANGHTPIAELLIGRGAKVEHESEGGRTPLMKAARAGHLEAVQFLVSKGADVNRATSNADHTVLSLACAGGHLTVVQYLLLQGADPSYILKDNSTMLIEASRGGHAGVVSLLLRQPKFTEALRHQILAHRQQVAAAEQAAAHGPSSSKKRLHSHSDHQQPSAKTKKHHLQQSCSSMASLASSSSSHLHQPATGGSTRQLHFHHPTTINQQQPVPPQVPATVLVNHPSVATTTGKATAPVWEGKAASGIVGGINAFPGSSPPMVSPEKAWQQQHFAEQLSRSLGQSSSLPVHSLQMPPLSSTTGEKIAGCVKWVHPHEEAGKSTPVSTETGHHGYHLPGQVSLTDYPLFPQLTPESIAALPSLSQRTAAAVAAAASTPSSATSATNHGNYLLPSIFAQSPVYSGRDLVAAGNSVADGGEVVGHNHISAHQQQALMSALETLVLQAETIGQDKSEKENVSLLSRQQQNGGEGFHGGSPLNQLDNEEKGAPGAEALSHDGPADGMVMWSATDASKLPQFSIGSLGASPVKQDPPSSAGAPGQLSSLEATSSPMPTALDKHYLATFQSQMLASLERASFFVPGVVPQPGDIVPGKFAPGDTGMMTRPVATDPSAADGDTTMLGKGEQPQPLATSVGQSSSLMHRKVPQPIYSPDISRLKQLTHRVQGVPTELLATDDTTTSLQGHPLSSLLLDTNFSLDIPPPREITESLQHIFPAGYPDTESVSSSIGGEADDEEEDDDEDEEEDEEEEEEGTDERLQLDNALGALPAGSYELAIDIDQQTDSNHDTALTLAAAGGHEELVELLLNQMANLEHRDKKGCTPLILAANAGHAVTVAILLDHNADIEAQTDRTKDTALSLSCSSGRHEVVELLLSKNADYEHRNVSDYTPLSLAASGGYVNIIKLLLKAGADINSRTGSKLGISPLMLAAMNGHTPTVKLLLDMGSDINAQIETNRNTALTLACFQGRHEVVSLLVERQANVEHRAKTGLTPLMEAASGGYHEVGKVLIAKGADVNAAPVPSSRDTALTIAADKGHFKFVELLLRRGANVDVKNKKGNSPLWLAANGGHLDVVRLLVQHKADLDSQDNRKVSCLMASFRKGHYKVVKFMVDFVTQFPSDADLTRYVNTLSDKELLKKCQRCMDVIIMAKERQAVEANKNASILLQELDQERQHEESRRAAAARRRARKKKQKEKKQAQKALEKNGKDSGDPEGSPMEAQPSSDLDQPSLSQENKQDSLAPVPTPAAVAKAQAPPVPSNAPPPSSSSQTARRTNTTATTGENRTCLPPGVAASTATAAVVSVTVTTSAAAASSRPAADHVATATVASVTTPTSSPRKSKKEEGWKEVGKRTKKLIIPGAKFGQVAGKGSNNLAAIRAATGAHIEVEKATRHASSRSITIKGSNEAVKQAQQHLIVLLKDPSRDVSQVIQSAAKTTAAAVAPGNNPDSRSLHHLPVSLPLSIPTMTTGGARQPLPPHGGLLDPPPQLAAADHHHHLSNHQDSLPSGGRGGARDGAKQSGRREATENSSAAHSSSSLGRSAVPSAKLIRSNSSQQQQQDKKPTTSAAAAALAQERSSRAGATLAGSAAVTTATTSRQTTVATAVKSSAVRQLFTSSSANSSEGSPVSSMATTVSGASKGGGAPGTKLSAMAALVHPRAPEQQQHLTRSNSHPRTSVATTASAAKVTSGAVIVSNGPASSNPPPAASQVGAKYSLLPTPANPPSYVVVATSTPAATSSTAAATTLVSSAPSVAVVTTREQSQNVFEQIMKTPSIFQEAASQIAQPKKYSDAVGKKPPSVLDGNPPLPPVPAKPPPSFSSAVGGSSSGGVYKLNLAPGSRPSVGEVFTRGPPPYSAPPTSSEHKSSLWNDDAEKGIFLDGSVVKENLEEYSSSMSPLGGGGVVLGPIGQPGPIAPPSRPVKATSSPLTQQVSPQRGGVQTPPIPKSPLLGHAPPGYFPFPDKGNAFRPIHPEGTDMQNVVPTQVPTPLRNNRPPLLATPPGFPPTPIVPTNYPVSKSWPDASTGLTRSPMSKRAQKPSSPFQVVSDGNDRGSPNKSPSQMQAMKLPPPSSFNPNAPSFIPMALTVQPGGPVFSQSPLPSQTTSSILGNPPASLNALKYTIPGGGSILGSAPPISTTSSGSTSSGRVGPSPSIVNQPPPPPPPIQTGPPLLGNQPSLLGNPPVHLLVSPNFQSVGNRLPNPVYYGNQMDNSISPMNVIQAPPGSAPPIGHTFTGQFAAAPGPQTPTGMSRDSICSGQEFGPSAVIPAPPGAPVESGSGFGVYITGSGTQATKAEPGASGLDPKFTPWNQFDAISLINSGVASNSTVAAIGDLNILEHPSAPGGAIVPSDISTIPAFQPPAGAEKLTISSRASAFTPVAPGTSGNPDDESSFLASPFLRIGRGTNSLAASSAFPVLPAVPAGISTSNVWTYSPDTGSGEDAGWAKPVANPGSDQPGGGGDWPLMLSSSVSFVAGTVSSTTVTEATSPSAGESASGGGGGVATQDDLGSVLGRLGLDKYHPLFQRNEIDLSALMLMSDKDFTEVGIPKGPRVKLLNAIGRRVTPSDASLGVLDSAGEDGSAGVGPESLEEDASQSRHSPVSSSSAPSASSASSSACNSQQEPDTS